MKKVIFKNKKLAISLVVVFVFSVSTLLWGQKFIALAGELIDSFTDTSRVDNTWNVQVDTGAGEIKLATRTCDSNDWICAQANICLNSFGDGEYILVATSSLSSSKQWKTSNTACDIPQCGQDGGQDGDELDADNTVLFTDYPARDACKQAGGRLPTRTELSCIYTNRASFNDDFGTDLYWSSTEYSGTIARGVSFSSGSVDIDNKTSSNSVRCVLGW